MNVTLSPHLSVRLFCVSLLLYLAPETLFADTVELSGGGHLTGKVERLEEKKIDIVAVDDDLSIAIPVSRVRRVVDSGKLAKYREYAALVGEDAEKHYQLAVWCAEHIADSKDAYKRFHMQMAIRYDPEHPKARASLDYVKEKGKWIRYTDLQRSRGMIYSGGNWVLPEAAAIGKYRDSTNVDAKKWIKEVERLIRTASRSDSKGQEAFEALRGINDPLAASAIAKQLADPKQSRTFKMLWVELLGRFRNQVSVVALVQAGVEERDNVVREEVMEKLQEYGSDSAIATYVAMLRSPHNDEVLRAARALSFFPDPELALTYVDALMTKHTTTIAPGPGIQAGTNSATGGLGSFSTGGDKPKVVTKHLENPQVLTLLKMIEPQADFGYNELAWRQYFAAKRGRASDDLRRDH